MNRSNIGFFVTLLRGLFAVTLGIALIFQQDKTRPILGNFMGMYWLASGIVSLRFGATGRRARGLPLLAGVVGVFAGVAMLGRSVASEYVAEGIIFAVLGIMIILTGFLHIFGGFRTELGERRRWSWKSFLLGLFEIVLGVLLIVEPLEQGTFVYIAASVWALIGGLILVGDALRIRQQANLSQTKDSISIDSDTTGDG
jgi:uncharacterized membrane protein HdeD (DUF308 family)